MQNLTNLITVPANDMEDADETKLSDIHKEVIKQGNEINKNIKEDGEKTRELIINKSMEITKEIMDSFNNLPPKYRDLCPEKLWMLARHPEFVEALEALKKCNHVIERTYYYEWKNYKGLEKQPGKNILAYFIYCNANLEDYIKSNKFLKKTKKSEDNEKNKEKNERDKKKLAFEPFSIGFHIPDLQDNFKNGDRPNKYSEFITELNKRSGSKITFK